MSHARLLRVSRWKIVALVVLVAIAVLGPATAAQALVPGPITPGPIIPPPIFPPILPPWILGALSASQPATVTGFVKDVNGNGVPNMTVRIDGETSSSTVPNFMQTAVTKADGSFCISDVIQGTYNMYVEDLYNKPSHFAETWGPWHDDLGSGDTRHWVQGAHTTDAGVVVVHRNGAVSGHAMDGANPVAGSLVVAHITDSNGVVLYREAITNASGAYSFQDAPPGDWSLTYSGSGNEVPVYAVPKDQNGVVVTQSTPTEFTLAEGANVSLSDGPFHKGDRFDVAAWDQPAGTHYNVAGANFSATLLSDPSVVYYWQAGDSGSGKVCLPPGDYDLVMQDSAGLYDPKDCGTINMTGGATNAYSDVLTPKAGTFAVTGRITEAGSGSNLQGWVKTEYVGGPNDWPSPFSNTLSNSDGQYLVRLPVDPTADPYYLPAGWPARLTYSDVDVKTHATKQYTVTGTTDIGNINEALPLGGVISGTVHDSDHNVVEGVQVSARVKRSSPGMGPSWSGDDTWWTRTDAAGNYQIVGLPANTDYKVCFTTYYDYDQPLAEKYEVYYRRVYHGMPLVDSLVESATPIGGVVDHTAVPVTLGATTANIDETISPGGYVGLHADGPDNPTGAVWCDVMYQSQGQWFEVDSGFTTGGTFQKLWKVLPTGSYRLDYSDYFGRGSGTWMFNLAAGETKYGSVLVPAPLTPFSAAPGVKATFAGLVNGGLDLGGTGGAQLNMLQLPSVPPTAPPPPPNFIPSGGVFDFSVTGATTAGTWSFTLPYDASVPDNLVGSLRVRHIKADGTAEILVPFAWNTSAHTLQVQTTSLSPFQVMFMKTKPSLGKPVAPSTAKHTKAFSVYGSLSPRHTAGGKSVRIKIYKLVNHKWKYTTYANAKNYNYSSYTRYKVNLKLKAGSYRLYAYAPADTWHLSTTSSYKLVKVK